MWILLYIFNSNFFKLNFIIQIKLNFKCYIRLAHQKVLTLLKKVLKMQLKCFQSNKSQIVHTTNTLLVVVLVIQISIGYNYYSLYYTSQYGIQLSSDYSYTCTRGTCKYSSSKAVAKNIGIYSTSNIIGDVNAMKSVVLKQPLMVYIVCNSDFYIYSSGL